MSEQSLIGKKEGAIHCSPTSHWRSAKTYAEIWKLEELHPIGRITSQSRSAFKNLAVSNERSAMTQKLN
jgi:hypothetical protein